MFNPNTGPMKVAVPITDFSGLKEKSKELETKKGVA